MLVVKPLVNTENTAFSFIRMEDGHIILLSFLYTQTTAQKLMSCTITQYSINNNKLKYSRILQKNNYFLNFWLDYIYYNTNIFITTIINPLMGKSLLPLMFHCWLKYSRENIIGITLLWLMDNGF